MTELKAKIWIMGEREKGFIVLPLKDIYHMTKEQIISDIRDGLTYG